MSASWLPVLSVWTNAWLKEIGIPMLELMVSSSSAGTMSWMRCSRRATSRSVSSSRVPIGAR